jgi:type VI secretion system secreted protein VgrG
VAAKTPHRHFIGAVTALVGIAGLLTLGLVAAASPAGAATAKVDLGTAATFSVLGASAVTNTTTPGAPTTELHGDLGINPNDASSITGFPPGIVDGATVVANAALQPQIDLTAAYGDAAGRSPTGGLIGPALVGTTLTPGVYKASTSLDVGGPLTLDGQGDPNAVFIFQVGSTLVTDSASSVVVSNGAQACNVFWQVGSSATLGTGSTFKGTIMANDSVTVTTGVTVEGQALARTGAVTLDHNTFSAPGCAATAAAASASASAYLAAVSAASASAAASSASAAAASSASSASLALAAAAGSATATGSEASTVLAATGPNAPVMPLLIVCFASLAVGGLLIIAVRRPSREGHHRC